MSCSEGFYRRRSSAQDENDATLQAFETRCDRLRRQRVFDFGEYSNLAASTILSIVAPGIAVACSATLRNGVLRRRSRALYMDVVGMC